MIQPQALYPILCIRLTTEENKLFVRTPVTINDNNMTINLITFYLMKGDKYVSMSLSVETGGIAVNFLNYLNYCSALCTSPVGLLNIIS